MDAPHALKTCPICGAQFGPKRQDSPDAQTRSRERHRFKTLTYCGPTCQGTAFHFRASVNGTTRSSAAKRAGRLKPYRPCERCGETRRSQVHHRDRNYLNNAPENLERLCHWCHSKEHAPEIKARAHIAWQTRKERYGAGGHR
jgi:phage terminase large subunit GpA-like protein